MAGRTCRSPGGRSLARGTATSPRNVATAALRSAGCTIEAVASSAVPPATGKRSAVAASQRVNATSTAPGCRGAARTYCGASAGVDSHREDPAEWEPLVPWGRRAPRATKQRLPRTETGADRRQDGSDPALQPTLRLGQACTGAAIETVRIGGTVC